MIRTVQQLREALHDAPDDMRLRVLVAPGVLCVLVPATLKGSNNGKGPNSKAEGCR